ncbi:neprilysin-like [Osmia bicornis bicornis]|uniref:neprilysin-like n=1 Tax=Osmia bicornis bicornis TaxID=1437191 RepID=UPI001EAF4864|nr:neprilysin-like [Osmia bicornis bicornis]XP_029033290.2 neprilysin-like [Osmia bicornis bicornis]XP_029033297.2 neprilysin-like [Osmia bicornis bicornis]XP_046141113.1 neprilysin-like [Osmia bicornis bicornis]
MLIYTNGSVQDFTPSKSMQLLSLICQLTMIAALPASFSVDKISRLLNVTNGTESHLYHDYYRNREHRICETSYCNEIAKKILQNRDLNADPCEDFYQHACGSWTKHNPIPDNEVEWSEDQIVMEKTHRQIRDALEERDDPTDIPPVKKAKKLYRSCMNTEAIEKRGIRPIQEILDQTGGWPMAMPLNEWDPDKFPWQKIDKDYVRLIGNSAFYNLEYEVDQNNTKRYVLTMDQDTEYPLSNKKDINKLFYDDDSYALSIYHIIQVFAREKGYTLNRRELAMDIAQMMYFEIDLLQIIEIGKEVHATTDNYEKMTIEELQKWYNSSGVRASTAKINFLELIQHAFMLANISINASEPIVVYNPAFLHKLARLLANTSPRVLVNYVQWNMVDKFLLYTTEEMRDLKFNMSLSSYNISNYMPRWQICVFNMRMKNAISYMFVKRHISDDVVHEATKMVRKVKDELIHRIMQAHWIPTNMKLLLLEKMDTLRTQIGYPDWYKDDHAVTEYYEGLEIGSDYFENILKCGEAELIKSLKDFKGIVVRDQWLDYPITVNAFYTPIVNAILIPAAELQDPYFTSLLPDAINYGTTGFVIGHELSHSLDNEGIQFDKDGYKISWNSQNASGEYDEKAQCFVDQYDNYTLDITDKHGHHIKVDGQLTEDENLADSIGIQIAYAAFKTATKHKHQTRLPGLEYVTSDELFFLAFANSWCSSTRPEYEADVINSDEHSPPKYRIIGSLSNMPAFSKTFRCSRNSTMNPRHKCSL